MKKTLLPLFFAALTLLPAKPVSAWGFFGHRIITQVAIYELPAGMQAFYYRHMAELVRQSTVPDERRSSDPTEGPKHFIDMDHYSEDNPFAKVPKQYEEAVAKFTADTLKKYGTVPWVVMETKENLVEAFRQRDTTAIIKYSAELGHYVGDTFVPLHTTVNYDGQLTNQQGLHSLWESKLPEKFINDYKLDGEAGKPLKEPLMSIWGVLAQSYGFVGETLDRATAIDKTMKPEVRYTFSHRYGKTQRQYSEAFADAYEKSVGGMVSFRLKAAPSMVASFWLTAWQEAGKPDLNALMKPTKPGKEEKEKLATELTAWKKNTLPQDQLLLAQQKTKKVEAADAIKAAEDGAKQPTAADLEPVAEPKPATPAAAPAVDKLKVKEKTADGKSTKQKAKKADPLAW